MQTNSKNTLQKLFIKYIGYSSKHPVGTRVYCPFAYKSGVVYCDPLWPNMRAEANFLVRFLRRKSSKSIGFLKKNKKPIDLRRVF